MGCVWRLGRENLDGVGLIYEIYVLSFVNLYRFLMIICMENNIAKKMKELPQRIDGYVVMAKRISMMLYGGVIVVDYRDYRLLYVSDYLKKICQVNDEEIKNGGLDVLYDSVCDDWNIVKSRKNEIMMGVSSIKETGSEDLVATINLHAHINGINMMVYNKVMVLEYDENNLPMIGLGVLVPSLISFRDRLMVNVLKGSRVYEYFVVENRWEEMVLPIISEDERMMLGLAMSGNSVEEMAKIMCKSVDTIKFYRKHVFAKLGARNISEAISKATTYCLL